jgi:hypothetical protein
MIDSNSPELTIWSADVYPKAAEILLAHSIKSPIQQEKEGQGYQHHRCSAQTTDILVLQNADRLKLPPSKQCGQLTFILK